jgi:hypothetical protein
MAGVDKCENGARGNREEIDTAGRKRKFKKNQYGPGKIQQ